MTSIFRFWSVFLLVIVCDCISSLNGIVWNKLNLPEEHLPYYFYNQPAAVDECKHDDQCPFKEHIGATKCWGYENKCEVNHRMSVPVCSGDFPYGWAKDRDEQVVKFWTAADYGYIKERMNELTVLCEPQAPTDSYLACARYMRYCRAKNIFFNFNDLNSQNSRDRFRENLFQSGQVGGHCRVSTDKLKAEGEHKSPLQSWYAELENFSQLDGNSMQCEIIVDKPSILIKLDAGVNMYHHFCDFINIYASQHVNGSFSTDVNIIVWDTSEMHYGDFFHDTWKVFTDYSIIRLHTYNKKKICIKDAMFSLLPRMRYGLYYNMPLIPGCQGSSLVRSFSQHVLHRMHVTQQGPLEKQIRVTLLARGTKFRRILNQDELIAALKSSGEFHVTVVDYSHQVPLVQQLQTTYNSDVFIGMHGAGLTHLLFQPDWAVIFELYNCDDINCYKDLARLRGIEYMTWQNNDLLVQEDEGHHPQLGAHKKFTNYSFNVVEFMRLVRLAADHVRQHPRFIEERDKKFAEESPHNKTEL